MTAIDWAILFTAWVVGWLAVAVLVRCGRRYASAAALCVIGTWGWVNVDVMAYLSPVAMRIDAEGREWFRLMALIGVAIMLGRLAWKRGE